jgi:CRISPR-associated protein Cas1
MRRMLNTLFVTRQGAYLTRDGETVEVRVEKQCAMKVPIHTLGGVVCFGRVSASPPLMGLCAEKGVLLSFMSESGRFLARVQGPVTGNVLLRREQYRRADDPDATADIARAIVAAKAFNSRKVLQRGVWERPHCEQSERLTSAPDINAVRGCEGDAARMYFSVFDDLITGDRKAFRFQERSRRPPLDNVNALLSFLYTLLAHDLTAAAETVGLDPAVGFLHRDRPGRPGLALDLMEELRPILVDRLVLSLVNRGQVRGKGFQKTETGGVSMNDETRKTVITAYQERKQKEIQHPFLNEKTPLGLLPHLQALLMARYLRGDLDGYAPYLWR